jgi:hypothetical protein
MNDHTLSYEDTRLMLKKVCSATIASRPTFCRTRSCDTCPALLSGISINVEGRASPLKCMYNIMIALEKVL